MPTAIDGPEGTAASSDDDRLQHAKPGFWSLVVGSAGVVYGDIGTSPLYAFREAVAAATSHGAVTREAVLGVLSLILWALILIVTVKYVLILLRADNNGEGGTLSLMALALRALGRNHRFVLLLGIVGAALFYGDAMITPAISVLSAVEGLKLATPALEPFVIHLAVLILIPLFLVQSRGTAKVAAFFGPIMVLWFVVMALGGLIHIGSEPVVLWAFDPRHAVGFLASHGTVGLFTLGAVFLAVTGAEALYADLGHFGKGPIRFAWLALVLPSLALNYLGQGALVLTDPSRIANPFYLLFPAWSLVPVVLLATAATVIASQAVITGAFSLSRQAIQLGLLPRMEIRYTSEAHAGQIYLPRINAFLLLGVLFAVGAFHTSGALAAAYGIAVTGTMVVTAIMTFIVIWKLWHWNVWVAALVMVPFLVIDSAFLAANLLKVFEGGLFPILLGAMIVLVMLTWRQGYRLVTEKTRRTELPLPELIEVLRKSHPHRVKGTAVFLTSDPDFAPTSLLHNVKHNKVLHEKNVIMTVATDDRPRVPDDERVTIEPLSDDFSRVRMLFGYAETPNVPRGLAIARSLGWRYDIMSTSFFVSRRSLKAGPKSPLPKWRSKIFLLLARNASDATDFFQIPTGRVVEVGTQVTI